MTDLVLTNACIRTMDAARPGAEALLIREGRIAALGPAAAIAASAAEDARVIDAGGRQVLPGFQDARLRLLSGGADLVTAATLTGSESLPDLRARLAVHAARNPDLPVILGAGWHFGTFTDTNLTAISIDAATGGRPAVIRDAGGQRACLNSAAMTMAGITREIADPPGGRIVRTPSGQPTGMLHGGAIAWAMARLPPLTDAQYQRGLLAAQALAHAHGLTGVTDPRMTGREARIYAQALEAGELTLRVAGVAPVAADMPPEEALPPLLALRAALPEPDLHLFAAGLVLPDDPDPVQLAALVTALDAARFQLRIEAATEAARALAQQALRAARGTNGAWPALHKITPPPAASVPGLMARLPPAAPRPEDGLPFCLSSDWPADTLNPFAVIAATDPALTVEDCVLAYTAQAAAAAWRGDLTGRLLPGLAADLVLLDRDIFALSRAEVAATQVLLTLCKGEEVFRAPGFTG